MNFLFQADNGEQAVQRFEESLLNHTPFDAIFMDEIMPVMKGSTAISIIRRLGYQGKMISLTGIVTDEDRNAILLSGADFVVSKPLLIQNLENLMKGILYLYKSNIYWKGNSRV